jgi:hypothetical protein
MGGRNKNVKDPMLWSKDIRKTKYDLLGFFGPTFSYKKNIEKRCFTVSLLNVTHMLGLYYWLLLLEGWKVFATYHNRKIKKHHELK